ncbi:MAG: rRNA maturation RNase YbeY [Kordia sp.]|nr:MAG: rRNA maturation RNase YbeY [Kordia sp.]
MISFNYESEFTLKNEAVFSNWIEDVITSESYVLGEVNYIFCNDEYLHKINLEFLNHDTLTDIITFDNTVGKTIYSDIFISIERVKDNAKDFKVTFEEELKRVVIHGVLHLCGYKDKSEADAALMRSKENDKIKMFHMEQ